MTPEAKVEPGYSADSIGKLELIWGQGFMSPGGPAEVGRILGVQDITGCRVLDIGSGSGGAGLALARNHGAGGVVGIDVEARLVDLANERAGTLGLQSRVRYQPVTPGPMPFGSGSFDVVFSKDAIIHIRDKAGIYAEALRVLRPGGRLLVGDWLRGEGEKVGPRVRDFVDASGHDFTMLTLREIGAIVETLGFVDIELVDRQAWYLGEARGELAKLRGVWGPEFVARWGEKALADEIDFWEVLVAALEEGAMRPGHIRARKP